MKPTSSLLTALALAAVAATAAAQDAPPLVPPADPPVRPVPPVPPDRPTPLVLPGRGLPDALKPFDANDDGRLSREEYKAYIEHQRPEGPESPWDANGDGRLSAAEIAAARAEMRAKLEARILARFAEADVNENGSLDLEEFQATLPGDVSAERAAAAFARLDANGDEAIGSDEFLKFHGLLLRPDVPLPPRVRPEAPKAKPPVVPPLPEHLQPIDTDKNGILSRTEILAAMERGVWPPRPKRPTDDEGEGEGGDADPPADPETPE